MGNTFIFLGFVMIVIGLVFHGIQRFGFPTLPGDILVQWKNVTFYFPIVTAILVSIILTFLLNLFR